MAATCNGDFSSTLNLSVHFECLQLVVKVLLK